MKKKVFALILLVLACSGLLSAQPNYKIAKKIPVEGDGWWDYISVDGTNNRIFVSHSNMAQAVDIKTGKVAGTIPDTKGIHGIAIAADLNKGFTSNGRDSSVTIFNLKTFEIIKKVYVTGQNPDAILYDPFSHKVFTFNGRSSNSTVIDANENKVLSTIPLDGKPEFAVTDGKGKIFVNIEDKSMINVINAATGIVTDHWSIAPGEEPSGLAMDKENNILFSVCDNKLMVVIDAKTGKVITTLPIGSHCDGATYDPLYKRAYSSNGEGNITVVQEENPTSFKVLETIVTQPGARTITIDYATHHLYLPVAEYDSKPSENKRRPDLKPGTFTIIDVETQK